MHDDFDRRCLDWAARANDVLRDGATLYLESAGQELGLGAASALLLYERMVDRQLDVELRVLTDAASGR